MKSSWSLLPFESVFEDCSGGNAKTPQSDYKATGRFAVVDQGKDLVAGYVDDQALLCNAPLPAIVFGDHTRIFKFIDFPFCMGADGTKVLRPKVRADEKFLYYYLRSLDIAEAGYSRHFRVLKRMKIALPPLEEQRRIAAILDKVDALSQKRRVALQKLDSLTQSLFLDMFGDPVLNPKMWAAARLENVTFKITDGEHLNPIFSEEGMPVIMAGNVQERGVDIRSAKKVDMKTGEKFRRKCGPEPGDLLLVSRGATIGRLCYLTTTEAFCLMGSVILIKPVEEKIDPHYLSTLLKHPAMRSLLYKTSGSSAQQAIYLKDLKKMKCLVPPMDLQVAFSKTLQALRGPETIQQQSRDYGDFLFSALQHRAFRGEL